MNSAVLHYPSKTLSFIILHPSRRSNLGPLDLEKKSTSRRFFQIGPRTKCSSWPDRESVKKIHLLPLCSLIHSNQMLICSGFYNNSSQSYNHKESLGNESLGVCFAFCIRKRKIYNFNFVLSIPTSKHPLAPSVLYLEEMKLGHGQTWTTLTSHLKHVPPPLHVRVTFEECT